MDLQEQNINVMNNEDIGNTWVNPPKEATPDIPTYTIEVAYQNSITAAIIVITVIIIGAFLVWILILVFNDTPPVTLSQCLPDRCATNVVSGVKRCPPPGETIMYNTDIETCNSRFFCDSSLTPLAQQLDGSTNISGVCPTNVECRCLMVSENIIPTYVTTTFNGVNGNPYTSLKNQRLTFQQSLVPSLTQIPNITTGFFSVPSTWLARSSPGCTNLPTVIDFEKGVTGCDPICQRASLTRCFNEVNPCLQGSLAFIPSSASQQITARDLNNMTYSCVREQSCAKQLEGTGVDGNDYILIRDYLSGEFLCYNINDIN